MIGDFKNAFALDKEHEQMRVERADAIIIFPQIHNSHIYFAYKLIVYIECESEYAMRILIIIVTQGISFQSKHMITEWGKKECAGERRSNKIAEKRSQNNNNQM